MPRTDNEEWSCSLQLDNGYIGKITKKKGQDELKIFGEMTYIGNNKYQIVPIDITFHALALESATTEEDQHYITRDKATVFLNGEKYEGEVLIIEGKNVTISDIKVDSNVSEYDERLPGFFASLKDSLNSTAIMMQSLISESPENAVNLKSVEKTPENNQKSLGSQKVQEKKLEILSLNPNINNQNKTLTHSVLSVPSESVINATDKEKKEDIRNRRQNFLNSVKETHKKELEILKDAPNTNIVNSGKFVGSQVKLFTPSKIKELLEQTKFQFDKT